ncbi:MAG: aminoacyl-tRNA hydrolase [Elusimicrobiota bacterium]|jgi:PTH1 family peptidyl-tRNA hydrolase|nr:aminoacyl-tRNA hydrolase [Elusimicrobiota bacterium]
MVVKLFVGLGNPDDKYKNTRHNLGFEVLDAIANAKGLNFKNHDNAAGVSVFEHNFGKAYLLKPMTYMNNSGDPLVSFMNYYKIAPNEIFVFYDDFSIPLGEFKIKMNGSSAGHNGLKSIIARLNTENFARMKLGIGHRPEFISTVDFVLSKFHKDDKEKIDLTINKAVDFFNAACEAELEKAISGFK